MENESKIIDSIKVEVCTNETETDADGIFEQPYLVNQPMNRGQTDTIVTRGGPYTHLKLISLSSDGYQKYDYLLYYKRETQQSQDDAAAMDCMKHEQNTHEAEGFNIKIELVEIEPAVVQPTPSYSVDVMPKILFPVKEEPDVNEEPSPAGDQELSVEEQDPRCLAPATAVPTPTGVGRSERILTVCKICNKSCTTSGFKLHMRTHTGERRFSCSVCDAKFIKARALKSHKRVHTGERPFSCKVCEASFNKSGDLKKHSRVHTRERPFSCSVCDAKFSQSSHLKTHTRLHTGERPFSCKTCDATFIQSCNFKAHMLKHIGERPFSCTICDAKFTASSSLKTHVRIHSGERPFSCEICDAKFNDSTNFRKHQRIHTEERPFGCTHCNMKFIQSNHLKVHLRTHSGE